MLTYHPARVSHASCSAFLNTVYSSREYSRLMPFQKHTFLFMQIVAMSSVSHGILYLRWRKKSRGGPTLSNAHLPRLKGSQSWWAGTSIQWGVWRSVGLASAKVVARLERAGMGTLTPAQGLAALTLLSQLSASLYKPQVVVNPYAWDRLNKPGQAVPFIFGAVPTASSRSASTAPAGASSRPRAAFPDAAIRAELQRIVTKMLGRPLGPNLALLENGMDRRRDEPTLQAAVRAAFGVDLPEYSLYQLPSIATMHAFVSNHLNDPSFAVRRAPRVDLGFSSLSFVFLSELPCTCVSASGLVRIRFLLPS